MATAWVIPVSIFASSAEFVGGLWFRESSKRVKQGHFHGFIGSKAEGSSGNHSDLVVEPLDSASRDLSFSAEPVHQQILVSSQHTRNLLDRLQATAHGSLAGGIQKGGSS